MSTDSESLAGEVSDSPVARQVERLRSDLTGEQRAEALRIERIGFTSAGAKRKVA